MIAPALRGDTVVLLHSSASSARQWQPAVAALQAHFSVHAIDFHGHGARPDWQGGAAMTLADEVALVEPLLEQAGGAHLIGHSYGGAVALKLATRLPALVRSVVAYEPVLFGLLHGDAGSRRHSSSSRMACCDSSFQWNRNTSFHSGHSSGSGSMLER